MRTKEFWLDLLERALKTFAQALVAVIPVGAVLWEIPWTDGLGIAATATVISVLSSIVSSGSGDPETASLLTPKHKE
ncbi:holin [Corynebacterium aurimucosum]